MRKPLAVYGTAVTVGLTLCLGVGRLALSSHAVAAETEPMVEPSEQFQPRMMEGYPDWYIERLAKRQQKLLADLGPRRDALAVHAGLIILNSDEWNPGKTITVAFNGGTPRLHALIERIVPIWSQYGNVKFDFGRDASGHYRTWSPTDLDYRADVRVGFLPGGFWSAIGRDSTNPDINQPGNETMNFEGFDRSLPFEFAAIVRHEFGHALGLEHEHQSPVLACDFRWNDDPGYVRTTDKYGQFVVDSQGHHPGIYTVFGGPPNNWSKQRIDFNLRQLTALNPDVPAAAYSMGQFDKLSIMKYYYEEWMFASGNQSPCYSPGINHDLSDEDKKRIAAYYPYSTTSATARVQQKMQAIKSVLSQVPPTSLLARQLQARQKQLQSRPGG
jgi:hypothetical protein